MGLIVIGGGFAGLTAAIRAREAVPGLDVVVVEKPTPESNTQLSGMRIRAGISNRRVEGSAEIVELLESRNGGIATDAMHDFGLRAALELELWHGRHGFVGAEDRRSWFGPQWGRPNRAGKGRGRSVLSWLRALAERTGVRFVAGEATSVGAGVDHAVADVALAARSEAVRLAGAVVVLANGSAGGSLFLSTNKRIRRCAHELAYAADLPLVDSTLHMIHPFGNVSRDGGPGLGCHETDELAGADVYAGVRIGDEFHHRTSSDLLARHEAHYHFPALAQDFARFGDVVRLRFADGSDRLARVSHHYHHLAIETEDGVRVAGRPRLLAVGDASGIGHWTNHHERFPGFALLKCLVDAGLVAERAAPLAAGASVDVERLGAAAGPRRGDEGDVDAVRATNSEHLSRLLTAPPSSRPRAADAWIDAIASIGERHGWTAIAGISLGMAWAHRESLCRGRAEPLRIDSAVVDRLRRERRPSLAACA